MENKEIILFDGVCNLCNGSVNFVIDRDKNDTFRFAALQSEEGKHVLKEAGIEEAYLDSIVLLKNGKMYKKSAAALHIAKKMSGMWPLMSAFFIFPAFLRDIVYDFIARNRYKWFGRQEVCRIPSPELKAKFLSAESA
jgi:predicted DCC family thiol-disulfide oxidoreductase YuxK